MTRDIIDAGVDKLSSNRSSHLSRTHLTILTFFVPAVRSVEIRVVPCERHYAVVHHTAERAG